MSQKCEAGDEK